MTFKPFDSTFESFLEKGYIKDATLIPDAKHTLLRQGLLDYYSTYHSSNGDFYGYINKTPNGIILSEGIGHDFFTRTSSAILLVQLFIELTVKEILENVNPILITHELRDENTFLDQIINNNTSAFTEKKHNLTVNFSKLLQRLGKLVQPNNSIPAHFRVDQKYYFFAENLDMLDYLSKIRNQIVHKANRIMSKYSLELLFVNFIIPFITTYLRLNSKKERMLERKLHCKINILDSLCQLKLEVDYEDVSKYEETRKILRKINHLKELGRASYYNPIHMWETWEEENIQHAVEPIQDKDRKAQAELFSKMHKENNPSYKVNICPCCGVNSLGSFEDRLWHKFAYCDTCSYYVLEDIGEPPSEFGLGENKIFEHNHTPEKKYSLLWRIWRTLIQKLCGCSNKNSNK